MKKVRQNISFFLLVAASTSIPLFFGCEKQDTQKTEQAKTAVENIAAEPKFKELSNKQIDKATIITFDYPPIMDATDPKGGMTGQIILEAFNQVDVQATIEYVPPKRMLQTMIGKDNVLACIGPTALVKRANAQDKVIIMPPFVDILMVFVYHEPTHGNKPTQYTDLKELRGYNVGVIRGSNTTKILKNAGLKVEESSIEAQIKKLERGRIDYAAIGYTTGLMLIKKLFPGKENDFVYMQKRIMELPTSIYFNKEYPKGEEYAVQFKKGLDQIITSGEYIKTLERYYGKGKIPEEYDLLFQRLGIK